MLQSAPLPSGATWPTGCMDLSGAWKLPLRKVKVVWMRPSGRSAYRSTASKALRSGRVGMCAMTYQSPMKRGTSTLSARGSAGRGSLPLALPQTASVSKNSIEPCRMATSPKRNTSLGLRSNDAPGCTLCRHRLPRCDDLWRADRTLPCRLLQRCGENASASSLRVSQRCSEPQVRACPIKSQSPHGRSSDAQFHPSEQCPCMSRASK